jgi:2-oxoglutarate dehydrogenase E2 component (dihydrolipoamide succinyltransferase)
MPIKVIMPQLGESVNEGTITKWLKNQGDAVEEYEALLEINTDKVDTEIPCPASGVLLEILIKEGATVEAGELLAWIEETGETIIQGDTLPAEETVEFSQHSEGTASLTMETNTDLETPAPGRNQDLGFISPVVAKIAGEHHVDLFKVRGTGKDGRITKKDILNYLETREKDVVAAPLSAAPTDLHQSKKPLKEKISPLPIGDIIPHTAVRRAIAEHMVQSKHTSPHVTTVMEVDMSNVIAHRNANKDQFAESGIKLTYTAYFVAATVAGIKGYPIVNSTWRDEGILVHREINIGMAASLGEEGLIVPVIKNAEELSLLGLARTVNDLANRARSHQLKPDEVQGGTFTITNHGVSGSLFATPIISQPQCGILGVGAIQKRVVVISNDQAGDTIAIRPMAYLTLTFDHRILDGAVADYFLGKIIDTLQNWN